MIVSTAQILIAIGAAGFAIHHGMARQYFLAVGYACALCGFALLP